MMLQSVPCLVSVYKNELTQNSHLHFENINFFVFSFFRFAAEFVYPEMAKK